VPASRTYTIADLAAEPHYAARGNLERIPALAGGTIAVPGIVPKLSATPGAVHARAPQLGEQTDTVLHEIGLSAEQIAALRARGVIG
jgi:formyl-CoA transferase